jgi:hypothetical protein
MGRSQLIDYLQQHKSNAIDGSYHLPRLAYGQRRQSVESTVDQGIAIKKHQQRFFHSFIITRTNCCE